MRNVIFLILFSQLFISCNEVKQMSGSTIAKSVRILNEEYLESKTTYFELRNDSIIGNGKEVWEQIFRESQFVVYGELHNSKETSKLTNSLIPIMSKNNFNTMALEIGPNSALKLMELMAPPERTIVNLKDFNSHYYNEVFEGLPIPFISGVQDARFLESASKREMNIWGLDQEYYNSIFYFTDELLQKNKQNSNYEELQTLKLKADTVILKWFNLESNSEEEIDIFSELLKETAVTDFLEASNNNSETAKIIADLKISWDIYSRWRNDSHADRISYMRNNFLKYYESSIEQNKIEPKVFLKFGGLHASQIISNGAYDLGHFVNEIAISSGLKCTNINSWRRFQVEEDGEKDYLKEYPNYYNRYILFLSLAKRNQWTIIDLESIRKDVLNQKIKLPDDGDFHKINQLIQGYDYQLILPVDQYSTPNFKE